MFKGKGWGGHSKTVIIFFVHLKVFPTAEKLLITQYLKRTAFLYLTLLN